MDDRLVQNVPSDMPRIRVSLFVSLAIYAMTLDLSSKFFWYSFSVFCRTSVASRSISEQVNCGV